jgi:DNA-binding transcriptional ArsR family regulator
MTADENVYARLKRVFHEPNRLAILSVLCKEAEGLTFNDLKDGCNLTFGNLSSHLKTLQEAGIVDVQKAFVANKPCTTVVLTDSGREQFVVYLEALEAALKTASEAVAKTEKTSHFFIETARA